MEGSNCIDYAISLGLIEIRRRLGIGSQLIGCQSKSVPLLAGTGAAGTLTKCEAERRWSTLLNPAITGSSVAAAIRAAKSQARALRLGLARDRGKVEVCTRSVSRATVFMVCFVVSHGSASFYQENVLDV